MVIVALVTMPSLLPSMRRCLCHCQASVVALIACCQAGVVALIVMAPLLLMCRHLCHRHNCDCCPHDYGVVALVDAQASLLSLSWRCCPPNNGAIAHDLQRHCFSLCNGALPSSCWQIHPCCNGIFIIIIVKVSLSSSQ